MPQPDLINNPPHYTQGKIEVIEFLEDQKMDFRAGNAVKYICRYRWKGSPEEDLKKAIWYLQRLLADYEKPKEKQETIYAPCFINTPDDFDRHLRDKYRHLWDAQPDSQAVPDFEACKRKENNKGPKLP